MNLVGKELAKIGEEVIVVSRHYEHNKKRQTGSLAADGFKCDRNITVWSDCINYEILASSTGFLLVAPQQRPFGSSIGRRCSVYQPAYVLRTRLSRGPCQTKVLPQTIVTNDSFCGFVSAYVKNGRRPDVLKGTKFMHAVHN